MPTHDRSAAISADEARHRAGMRAFPEPAGRAGLGDRVGLEPELFPVQRDRAGRPAGRMLLSRPDGVGVLEVVDELAVRDDRIGARTGEPLAAVEYPVEGGGRLTFEPGAQVEHSTAVYPSVATAIGDVEDVLGQPEQRRRRLRGA